MAVSTRDRLGPIDYLIVGGGSAGCVMASRLSERAGIRVVLLESGAVFTPAQEPPGIGDLSTRAALNPGLMWSDLKAIANPDPAHPEGGVGVPYGQARVLGGGSSVNGMHAHRGLPGDYDEWSEFGVSGWGWSDVLPYFRKLEADRDCAGPLHGTSGPINIERWPVADNSPFEEAVDKDWRARQMPALDDLNGAGAVGRFIVPLSIKGGRRMSAARAYLDETVQARPNLTIRGDTRVEQLIIVDGQVRGVRAVSKGEQVAIEASHVVLCAGALASPSLLQRSGIGDGVALTAAGIEPLVHRPGVGANLQNHPTILLAAHLRKGSRITGTRPPCIMGVRYSSGLPDCAEADMITTTMGMGPDATAHNPLGRTIGALFSLVQKSYSRGSVKPTRDGNPKIVFDTFDDERDLNRLVMGWETIRAQLTTGPAAQHVNDVFGRCPSAAATTAGRRRSSTAWPPARSTAMRRCGDGSSPRLGFPSRRFRPRGRLCRIGCANVDSPLTTLRDPAAWGARMTIRRCSTAAVT